MCFRENFTPKQSNVSKLIRKGLERTKNKGMYLSSLDFKLNNPDSEYYLNKPVTTKIVTRWTPSNFKEDLSNLFSNDIPLPNIEVRPLTYSRSRYSKPFMGILCNNLDIIIAKQNFNGEPYLRGKFRYNEVIIPSGNMSAKTFIKSLYAVLNGFKICTGADEKSLLSLAHDITTSSPEYKKYVNIFNIVKKILDNNYPFKGRRAAENIIWNPDYDFTPREKNIIINKDNGKIKKNNTLKVLSENYKKGMTQKQLVKSTGLSITTVKRKWSEISVR